MKILHINTLDKGGAARAAIRLHIGLLRKGIDSHFLCLYQSNHHLQNSHKFRKTYPGLPKRLFNRIFNKKTPEEKHKIFDAANSKWEIFSSPDTDIDITQSEIYQSADIINLHWIAGFVDYRLFFRNNNKPVIWTLHDQNPFTGGCHYGYHCRLFTSDCHTCPQLKGISNPLYSDINFKYKQKALQSIASLNIVSPSKWLLQQSQQSMLFKSYKHYHIPNGIDIDVFDIRNKEYSRDLLGLPKDKKIILFVAESTENYRKGFHILSNAVNTFDAGFCLAAIGRFNSGKYENKIRQLGYIADERLMSAVYSAADVFVIPSIEDNFPNTVMESLACGTPVIGFNTGGIPDIVINRKTGLICPEKNAEALADTLHLFFSGSVSFDKHSIRRYIVENYALEKQAEKYLKLYRECI